MARATKAERESRMMMVARLRIAAELVGQVWRDAECPDDWVKELRVNEKWLEQSANALFDGEPERKDLEAPPF